MTHVPNLLSAFRIVAAPILLLLAWYGHRDGFVALFAAALLSDILDGRIARRFDLVSGFGAQLDQWGDFALWASLPFAAWWLWPDIVLREASWVALAMICLLLPTTIAWIRYREVPGYHTWSVKFGSVLMGVSLPLLLLFDFPWLFRVAASFQVVCALDELGITLLLAECRHDVPSVFHAARMRRRAHGG